jgi:hypothetical protein
MFSLQHEGTITYLFTWSLQLSRCTTNPFITYLNYHVFISSTSVTIDVESKALVEPENEKNATIVEVKSPGCKNEAKLHRGSALKQVTTCSVMGLQIKIFTNKYATTSNISVTDFEHYFCCY